MNHNWTHKDFQAHAQRQLDMQRGAENERRAREARSNQNMLLVNVGKTLEQLGHHLQTQYGTKERGQGQVFAREA